MGAASTGAEEAGWRGPGTRWWVLPWRCCTGSLGIAGPWPSWRKRWAPHGLSLPSASCNFLGSRRLRLPCALAPAACRRDCCADHSENHSPRGHRCWLQVGGRIQSRLQARVRPAASAVSPQACGRRCRPIHSHGRKRDRARRCHAVALCSMTSAESEYSGAPVAACDGRPAVRKRTCRGRIRDLPLLAIAHRHGSQNHTG